MCAVVPLEEVFLAALDDATRKRFAGEPGLAAMLLGLRSAALAAYPDISVDAALFAAELARRLGAAASPQQLARTRADHVHLAIACAAGDELAIRRFERELLDEVDATAERLRARADQADDVRSQLRRILFVSEPGRAAALLGYSGRGDLRSYLRVIATRELVRAITRARREVGVDDDAVFDKLSVACELEFGELRERYRGSVEAAMRSALAGLGERSRALLRYSLVDGWSVDRIGALYGIHRATAARRVVAARDELGRAIRAELAHQLAISLAEVDSIVRSVQSGIDVSIERLLT
jgi:RNA polymerase sigma-70 factor (ECF subfamily)